ncbi:MAG TPA: NAD-dependent epimerase/dehydratase family protein [Acidimicrobiales bacterium]
MRSVVVTGLAGALGQRVAPSLLADEVVAGDADSDLAGADTLVHLAWLPAAPRGGTQTARANVEDTRRLLAAADRAGVAAVVHLSSASVYGAWPDNPMPLTEEAALRPNPGVSDAIGRAEAERLVADWAADHPGTTVAVLRPATVVGAGLDSWLARLLVGHAALRGQVLDPPRQFVHVDDLAAALALAVNRRLDGVYNVAPDGSVAGDVVRGLTAGRPSLPVPGRLASAAAHWMWSLHLSDTSPDVLPLVEHPWVIANDRLRAAGWVPRHTNEEAVVAGRPGSWWREMGPTRRQQVALAGAGLGVVGLGASIAALVARARRRPTSATSATSATRIR